jgi:hypothetical protein
LKIFKEMTMKNIKTLFITGILTLLLSGCFNPITATPPQTDGSALDPFTVDVMIGSKQGKARSIAGLDAQRIKAGGKEGIRNIVQLIVTDSEGKIAAFTEQRRNSADEEGALLSIDIPINGEPYYFLLLMGHWDRNGETAGGQYIYKDSPPTLLAAGFETRKITEGGTITITMWPIVVDTAFVTPNTNVPSELQTIEPEILEGTPQPAELFPVEWDVKWTIKQGTAGDGLSVLKRAQDVMVRAGKIDGPNDPTHLWVKSKPTFQTDDRDNGEPFDWQVEYTTTSAETGNVITQEILRKDDAESWWDLIGISGSAYFNLEYVPFSLVDSDNATIWSELKDKVKSNFNLSAGGPVWIIRNGINDKKQDIDSTNFTNLGNGTANGNGAVAFKVGPR